MQSGMKENKSVRAFREDRMTWITSTNGRETVHVSVIG